ncbi:Fructosamine kinase-domain-containing protein [Xylariomycetidae sp. FL0641]|nr:Fructosamine kinase-domain-containing protein [Xylariomycetidae sp. FL0641]
MTIPYSLPGDCQVLSVTPHGKGQWSTGYKVEIETDGQVDAYFLKVIRRENHVEMARGEFESQKELQKYLAENVVIPLACGPLANDPSASFFLTRFRNLTDDKVADPAQLAKLVGTLHQTSASPSGKFGFHCPTYNGFAPLVNDWCDRWEEYFSRQFRSDIQWMHDHCVLEPGPEFDVVAEEFLRKVIPRLLRPLETGGRTLKPSLCHGDVWPGNVQIDVDTEEIILFDSCCCYGHNELDLCMWRSPRYAFNLHEHGAKYKEVVPPSEPVEDWDDRNALRNNIINAGLHAHRANLRAQVKDEMKRLLAKHPKGFDGFEEKV